MKIVDLNKYQNGWYNPGNKLLIIIWYVFNILFIKSCLPYSSKFKITVLKLFGAKIGRNVVLKPNISIKYPWNFTLGDNCWIGEGVWIDNLAPVIIGNNVCLSQGCFILTGSHNYKKETFDLIIGEITLEDGVWIGAKAIVCPNVKCKSHSVLSAGSVATNDLENYMIYQGNPALSKRKRTIN